MKKVLILIAAVLLTSAVHALASDLYESGDKNATFTAGLLCTPSFNITVPDDGPPWEVSLGNFFPDGKSHDIIPERPIKWILLGPAKLNGTDLNYMVRCSPTSNYHDKNVYIQIKWNITSGNVNTSGFLSGDFDFTEIHLAQDAPGVCNGYAYFEILAFKLYAETGAALGIRRFNTTLVVNVSI